MEKGGLRASKIILLVIGGWGAKGISSFSPLHSLTLFFCTYLIYHYLAVSYDILFLDYLWRFGEKFQENKYDGFIKNAATEKIDMPL